jgi:hypothetical protein
MSKIVDVRNNIIEKLTSDVPDLKEVNWFDGMFDQKDVADWSLKTPCAMVAVMTTPKSDNHSTGELNVDLRCLVVIIDNDMGAQRDADERVWNISEQVIVVVNQTTFHADAAPTERVRLNRLIHPDLRNEGAYVAIVEWHFGLMLGKRKTDMHEFLYYPADKRIVQTPKTSWQANTDIHDQAGNDLTETETLYQTDP